eukprot:TRINITY_DN1220_c0_g1_i10.p1 TRINITY_DN1220_c0_g1~~TRINITY_DN1220_c0_g1_i10.p1  ORF type:complete len:470 (+),score=86.08 TRINITY_DN1220_c0_g1_i10:310-1719(+)
MKTLMKIKATLRQNCIARAIFRSKKLGVNEFKSKTLPQSQAASKCVSVFIRKKLEKYYPKASTKAIAYKNSYTVSSRNISLPYSNYGNLLNKLELNEHPENQAEECDEEASRSENKESTYVKLPLISYPANSFTPLRGRSKNSSLANDTTHRNNSVDIYKKHAKNSAKRMIKEYGYGSKAGQMVIGETKQNQDSIIMEANFGKDGHSHLFAVADGHGQFGEKVSFFIKCTLPRSFSPLFLGHLEKLLSAGNELEAIRRAYEQTSNELKRSRIDISRRYLFANLSGATCSCVLLTDGKLFTGNVGDSRSLLCSIVDGKEYCRALTSDHKPSLPAEKSRIEASGGEVRRIVTGDGEEVGPYRVYVKGGRSPGLAMSRSFGDAIAASVGVTTDPDTTETTIHAWDKIVVLGSDGIWDRLSNEEVARIAFKHSKADQPERAVNAIIGEARKRWANSGMHIDDISCILVMLHAV